MSSPTAGNFDCARLQEIKVRLDSLINPNDVKAAEYIPDVAPLTMLQQIQTAQFPDLQDPAKDKTVKAIWMDDCDDAEPSNCSGDDCSISGSEIGTVCKEYALDQCFEKSFMVSEEKFRLLGDTVSFDEQVTISLAKKIKLMDEGWARRSVSAMDALAGTNLNTAPYTVSSTSTAIPSTAWNADLFGYFAVTKSRNKLPNMKLLLGGLMEQAFWKIGMETSNPDGQAAARKIGALGTVYTDPFIVEDVLSAKAAFLVSPSALAVVTKARYSRYGSGREEVANGYKTIYYTITSPTTKIVYDVIYQLKCVSGDWQHHWELKSRGAVLSNAVFCNTSRTGVLKFLCA